MQRQKLNIDAGFLAGLIWDSPDPTEWQEIEIRTTRRTITIIARIVREESPDGRSHWWMEYQTIFKESGSG